MNVPLLLKLPAKLNVPEVEVRVPAFIVKLFNVTALLLKLSVPLPAFVKLKVLWFIVPPTVNVLALTVTCLLALNVTLPVPRFNALLPVKVKSPFQLCALFVASVTVPPLVLSIVPPLIVNVPVPIAEFEDEVPEALMFNVPVLSVVPPV